MYALLMFIDAFLAVNTIGKQPECSSGLERIKRLDTYTQWNTIWPQKKEDILSLETTWMDF